MILGTSNWTEDYFTDSAGISIIFEPVPGSRKSRRKSTLIEKLQNVFLRDFTSDLADPV